MDRMPKIEVCVTANGFICNQPFNVTSNSGGCVSDAYVFVSFDEMTAWLRQALQQPQSQILGN